MNKNQLHPYLCSICQNYAQWWKTYTLTDVVGKQQDEQKQFSPLLDLMVQTVEQQQEKREEGKEKIERLAVVEGLRKYAPNHVLLVGRPGSGKSTALVRLLLEEAERGRAGGAEEAGEAGGERDFLRVPVLVELRYYQHSVLERVQAFLLKHQPNLDADEEILKKWLRQGRLLLLLDGFNELPSEEARQQVRVFHQDYPNTPMVFTTRDLGVGGDLNITKKLEMQPLTEAQMRQFVCAYLPEQGEQMLKQLGSRLREFGETPLLLWMLCSVFANNSNQIPANLGSVFRRFTEIYDKKLKQDILIDEKCRLWQRQLLQRLANLSDQQLKWDYLNYLKWTEPLALMMELLEDQVQAVRVVKLALEVDWLLGARLAGEVKGKFQKQTVGLVVGLSLPRLFKVELAGVTKSDEAIPELINALEYSNYNVRRSAADALGEIGSDAAVTALINTLEHSNSDVRRNAADALGKIGSDAAVPALINALEHSNSDVRRNAADALGKIGSDAAVPALINALEHSNSDVRRNAADALGKIGSDAAVPALINALKHSNWYVRENAAEALGKISSDAAVPALINALEDSNSDVRRNAAEALGKISSDAAVPALINALEDSNSDVRRSAAEALGKIGSDAAVPALINALEDSNSDVRRSAAEALGKIGSDAAVPALINGLEHSDYVVRWRAAEALGKIGSDAAGMATAKNGQAELDIPDNFIPTALPKDLIDKLKQGRGRAVFTSSTGKQKSWIRPDDTMSIYTFHFLEALQGAGNQPGDKVVTVSDLMKYVGKTVPDSAKQFHQKEQTPFFDFATEDFPVALLHGGKGMPQQGWDEVKSEAQEKISQIGNISEAGNQSPITVGDGSTNISVNATGNSRVDISK